CKVLHIGALVLGVEEIISSRKGNEILPRFSEGHLYQTHIKVRCVVRRDNEICMVRNIHLPFVFRAQQTLVKSALREIDRLITNDSQEFRNMNLFIAFL